MSDQHLFDPGPAIELEEPEHLSATQRLTLRNNTMIANGRHPATLRPLHSDFDATCGGCVHHHAYMWHNGRYHKCELHRLGESHSAASDIRVSWPACELYEPEGEQ